MRKLEICAFNIQSCFVAQEAGAARIELCASPAEGGVTPGFGTIQYAVEKLTIPVYVMIRPRGGNFVYSEPELDIMFRDIEICKQLGVPGIATGILKADNTVDVATMKKITAAAHPMGVTFHKAFDRTPNALEALEDVIACGCERILTSGLEATATEGAATIAQLVKAANGRIVIMPGGSVRSTNIASIAQQTGTVELHSSALVGNHNYVANGNEALVMAKAI